MRLVGFLIVAALLAGCGDVPEDEQSDAELSGELAQEEVAESVEPAPEPEPAPQPVPAPEPVAPVEDAPQDVEIPDQTQQQQQQQQQQQTATVEPETVPEVEAEPVLVPDNNADVEILADDTAAAETVEAEAAEAGSVEVVEALPDEDVALSDEVEIAAEASPDLDPNDIVTGAGPDESLLDDEGVVQVLFGTDRDFASDAMPLQMAAGSFGHERASTLHLGRVFVRIPTQHQVGQVERPWNGEVLGVRVWWAEAEDPAKHFTIAHLELLSGERFVQHLQDMVGASTEFERQALVFIHGFNVGFDAAAYRTAQIAYDLQFDGAPIFYSWPSSGRLTDYEYDQNSARQARRYLEQFLKIVQAESGADQIHLIAHSMGNDPLLEVLVEIAESHDGDKPLFNQVILAAPDIDVNVFHELANEVHGVAEGITLYASSSDRALIASREYARGVPRAGAISEQGPVIISGIDTIDVTAVGTNVLSLNHSEYADNLSLLDDIGRLLKTGQRPPHDRTPTLRRMPFGDGAYWAYPN